MPERSGHPADDALGERPPTSHERKSGRPWDASYHKGPAPWDIGRPQAVVIRLASEGAFMGAVLDVGCGTGENALHIAATKRQASKAPAGVSVLGLDVAETALAMAREKARERGNEVEFALADALHLERLRRRFQTVLDCGLFHTFDDADERTQYAQSLTWVTECGATLYLLCFSDEGPDTGPHPVSQPELRAAFSLSDGWNIVSIKPERLETRFHDNGAPAWLATIARIE
jgi:SAM-dependent methyltransferase